MRIVWSGDAAERIIRRLKEAEEALDACVKEAQQIRRDLDEANEDGSNRRLNAITNRYEAAVARLRRTAQEADDLVKAAKRAADSFEEAEKRAVRNMNSIDGEKAAPQTGHTLGRGSAHAHDFYIRPQVEWFVPRPMIIPTPRLDNLRPTPAWIKTLLDISRQAEI